MSVFVIGGAGFIGRRIVSAFASEEFEVFSLDVSHTSYFDEEGIRAKSLRLDLSHFEDVLEAMTTHRPEIVLNLSYMRETYPRAAMRVNVLGMDNCFEAARICNVKHVVYASSIAVNGRQKQYGDKRISETDPTYPTYQYAVHKVFNEWQAKEYREKHGMRITGIRVAHAAAPDKQVGAVDHVQCIVNPALGKPAEFDFRDTRRCVVHVDDVAEVFRRVALKEAPRYDLYNTGGQTLSLGEIAGMVRSIIPDADVRFRNEFGGDERSVAYLFDNSRLVEEFGISYRPYEERVAEMIASVRGR
jgi:nucleoside-diphosphate-sugar epimerase